MNGLIWSPGNLYNEHCQLEGGDAYSPTVKTLKDRSHDIHRQPTHFCRAGDEVLDLGSEGGNIPFRTEAIFGAEVDQRGLAVSDRTM
jgi:hypothetical protein